MAALLSYSKRERGRMGRKGKKQETKLVSQLVAELPCSDSRSLSNFISHYEALLQTLAACFKSGVPLREHCANSSHSQSWDGFLRWAHSHPAQPVSLFSQLIFHKDIYFSSLPHVNNTTYGHKWCVQPAGLLPTGASAKLSKQCHSAAWPDAHLSRLK